MGPRGLYLNRWSLSFDPEKDVPSVVPVWVRLPHLPLHCWNDETLQPIGNSLGKYIHKSELKGPLVSCLMICVEVDIEKGIPEIVSVCLDGWEHAQKVDYEKLPFKCKKCHEYGHFVKNCLKAVQENTEGTQEEGWKKAKKGSKRESSNPEPRDRQP